MRDDFYLEHGLRALPFRFISCPDCGTPVALLSFVDGEDLDSEQQIDVVRDIASIGEILPAYVTIRLPATDEGARVRKVWPEVAEYTLTREQWEHVAAGLLERHTCSP